MAWWHNALLAHYSGCTPADNRWNMHNNEKNTACSTIYPFGHKLSGCNKQTKQTCIMMQIKKKGIVFEYCYHIIRLPNLISIMQAAPS